MSRDYGKISSTFWDHPDIRRCSDDAKLIACYVLTTPHGHGLGAFLCPDGVIAEHLGWRVGRIHKAITELIVIGFLERFSDHRHLVVCRFLQWNRPENANVLRHVVRQALKMPLADPAMRHILIGFEQMLASARAEDESKNDGRPKVPWIEVELEPFRRAITEQRSLPWKLSANDHDHVKETEAELLHKPSDKPLRTPEPEPASESELEPEREPNPEPSQPLSSASIIANDGFEDWWSQYPKKVEKRSAKKLFEKIVHSRTATAGDLTAGAARYAKSCEGIDPKFIKHPTRWLNAGCWTDDDRKPTRQHLTGALSAVEGVWANYRGDKDE